jgi:hypothetical protein
MPTLQQVHIDKFLTNVSLAFKNEEYIADKVLPVLPVNKRTDKYAIYDPSTFLTGSGYDSKGNPGSIRQPGAEASEVNWTASNSVYVCESYALRSLVSDEEQQIADAPYMPLVDTTSMLAEKLMIDNELAVASQVLNPNKWAPTNTVACSGGTTSWAAYSSSTSNPFAQIEAGKNLVLRNLMRKANRLVLSYESATILADHPLTREMIKYTHSDAMGISGIPAIFREMEVVVGTAQGATNAPGTPLTTSSIWLTPNGQAAALVTYVNPETAGLRTISLGYTFDAPDAQNGAHGISTKRWYDWKRSGNMIQCQMTRTWQVIVQNTLGQYLGGYLITNTTA